MPNRGDRGGSKTRAHISTVATELFLRRGFDEVTIADVAAAAGVSKVTVFSHFERKEDLLLDRLPDAIEIVRTTIRDRAMTVGPVEALHRRAVELAEERHALSGLSERSEPFMRVLLASPTLIARLRAFAYEIEAALAADLDRYARPAIESRLVAALLVAAYRTVISETVRLRLDGIDLADVAAGHRQRLDAAFASVARAVSPADPADEA
jgi:AcrR family transcriptional regulator